MKAKLYGIMFAALVASAAIAEDSKTKTTSW